MAGASLFAFPFILSMYHYDGWLYLMMDGYIMYGGWFHLFYCTLYHGSEEEDVFLFLHMYILLAFHTL